MLQSKCTLYSFLNVKKYLLKTGAKSEVLETAMGLKPRTT